MTTIFWHDYETFGAEPRADRPAQFAGVRTDTDLNIIGEAVALYCRPTPDFLPHPEACLITGITPQKALSEGMPEAEFAARIHTELSQPGTCSAGYNSVRFDDEVTRYLLYRNLYDPYAREWRNGNSRWDIIDLARMAYALRPQGMEWPLREDGAPSFKLEHLSAANGLEHSDAHDALSDVYATIALARRLKKQQPRLYDFLFQLRDKTRAAAMFDFVERTPLLHTSRMFPAEHGCTAVVVPVARDPRNKNGVFVYDLRYDPAPLLELDVETVRARVFTAAGDLPEGTERVPLKTVHLNKCPALAPLNTLPEDAAARLQIDLDASLRHLERIKTLSVLELESKVQQVMASADFPPAPEAEAALYEGFIGNSDRAVLDKLRVLPPQSWPPPRVNDRRIPDLLWRYRARNYPHTLSAAEQAQWESYRRARLTDPKAGASIVADEYFRRIEQLRAEIGPEQQGILDELETYGREILAAIAG